MLGTRALVDGSDHMHTLGLGLGCGLGALSVHSLNHRVAVLNVDALEVGIGMPQAHRLGSGQAHRPGGVDVIDRASVESAASRRPVRPSPPATSVAPPETKSLAAAAPERASLLTPEDREALRRETAQLIARAVAETVSRRNPVRTTD